MKYLIYNLLMIPVLSAQVPLAIDGIPVNELKLVTVDSNTAYPELDRLIEGKRIVMLGEFSHGALQINQIKRHLVEYLHKRHGFSLLLLESGIGEIALVDQYRQQVSLNTQVRTLMGPWQTEDYMSWMTYLKNHPDIRVGGYDVQRTGSGFQRWLQQSLERLNIDGSFLLSHIKLAEQRFGEYRSKVMAAKREAEPREVYENHLGMYDFWEERLSADNRQKLMKDTLAVRLIRRVIHNRLAYLKYNYIFSENRNWLQRFGTRDSIMAANVQWFVDSLFPGQKVIISGHNYHIAKANPSDRVMGEDLNQFYGDQLVSVGIFGGAGSYKDNSGRKQQFIPNGPDDVQTLALRMPRQFSLVRIPSDGGPFWLTRSMTVNNSFVNLAGKNKLILRDSFDSLLFVRQINTPKPLPNKR